MFHRRGGRRSRPGGFSRPVSCAERTPDEPIIERGARGCQRGLFGALRRPPPTAGQPAPSSAADRLLLCRLPTRRGYRKIRPSRDVRRPVSPEEAGTAVGTWVAEPCPPRRDERGWATCPRLHRHRATGCRRAAARPAALGTRHDVPSRPGTGGEPASPAAGDRPIEASRPYRRHPPAVGQRVPTRSNARSARGEAAAPGSRANRSCGLRPPRGRLADHRRPRPGHGACRPDHQAPRPGNRRAPSDRECR
jgi:hypothetical protein